MNKLKTGWTFVVQRRASFSFTIGSVAYGFYHYFNQYVLATSGAYKVLDSVIGLIGGRYFGLAFVTLGTLKIYGLITDNPKLKIPIYFALLFLWLLLGVCFLLSYLNGSQNAAWIYSFIIAALSTSILSSNAVVIKEDE